jgi:uncharacterized membrane protein YhaH (DUF805 family)
MVISVPPASTRTEEQPVARPPGSTRSRAAAFAVSLASVLFVAVINAVAIALRAGSCISDSNTPVPHCHSGEIQTLEVAFGTVVPLALVLVVAALGVWRNRPAPVAGAAVMLASITVIVHFAIWG